MITELLKTEIEKAVRSVGFAMPADYSLLAPPKKEMGDFATNIALIISKANRENMSKDVADKLILELDKSEIIRSVTAAGPGFINIFLKDKLFYDELKKILDIQENYGRSNIGNGKTANVEYVSANPTGPLHIGNARGGPIGESIANLFTFYGFRVRREFYINDVGVQIEKLGSALCYWYEVKHDERTEFPVGGYPGDYVKEISEEIQKTKKDELKNIEDHTQLVEYFAKEGLLILIRQIKEACELIGISYDEWMEESEIQSSGKTDEVIELLQEKDFTVRREGALWFKRENDPEFSDKESVLKRSDQGQTPTYFADDIAYHKDKFDRGADILVDVWGANHHGHIDRLKSAVEALDYDVKNFHIILYQYVRLKNAGEILKMSKREGNFVTLKEVIENGVAPDAFKYFILAQNPNTPFDFDIKEAADTSEKNPVYYIKYAHARICSILAKSGTGRIGSISAGEIDGSYIKNADLKLLKENSEMDLIKGILEFPEILDDIIENYQIQLLPHYTYKIASLFHNFYTKCQVLTEDKELTNARLALITATKHTIANALQILDIEAPEKM
ncbi:MAG: arginine--tRNA ligase [Patescibacteria group bacterium]